MVFLSMGFVGTKFVIGRESCVCVIFVLYAWFSIMLVYFGEFLCWCCLVFLSIQYLLCVGPVSLG